MFAESAFVKCSFFPLYLHFFDKVCKYEPVALWSGGQSFDLHGTFGLQDIFGTSMRRRGWRVNELVEPTVAVHRKYG